MLFTSLGLGGNVLIVGPAVFEKLRENTSQRDHVGVSSMARISGSAVEDENVESAAAGGLLFDHKNTKGTVYKKLDVSFAEFIKHEQLSWPELFEGFETLRAITYSSSASFIRDLFGQLREIEVIFWLGCPRSRGHSSPFRGARSRSSAHSR